MSTLPISHFPTSHGFELRFESLVKTSPALAFPCDALGVVNIDAMSARARNSYLGARALLGRDYRYPVVCRV